jgi:hypothetical protein
MFNILILLFLIANAADLILTLNLKRLGFLIELNPLASIILIYGGTVGLIIFKVMLIGAAATVLVITNSRSPRFTLTALAACTILSCVAAGSGIVATIFVLKGV